MSKITVTQADNRITAQSLLFIDSAQCNIIFSLKSIFAYADQQQSFVFRCSLFSFLKLLKKKGKKSEYGAVYAENSFVEVSKNLATDLKIILLNCQDIYVDSQTGC